MKIQYAPDVIRTPLAYGGVQSTRGLLRNGAWEKVAAEEETGERVTAVEEALEESDTEIEDLVLQYFGDIRRFTLLSREEERALWQRIERERRRLRRALYTSPIGLQTLSRIWRQVQAERIPLHHVVKMEALSTHDRDTRYAHVEQSLRQLQALAPRLWHLNKRPQPTPRSAPERRAMRQKRLCVWQEWIAIWEALQLHSGMYDAMHFALDVAYHAQPHNPALYAASRAWKRAQRELEQTKAQMLRANLRLVIYVAKRYRHRGVPFLDLIQEGNIGLMRALDKFEPQRGLKFVTYAHWWVRQAVTRATVEQHSSIRLPSYMVDRRSKLRATREKLGQVYGRVPNAQELSTALGWTPHKVEALQGIKPVFVRLHEPVTGDGRRLEEAMEDERTPQPDICVAYTQLRQRVVASLADLPEREAQLLRLRFGLDTDHPHSLQEIGTLFGLSRERVRQLEKLTLEKLRLSASAAVLADFAEVIE